MVNLGQKEKFLNDWNDAYVSNESFTDKITDRINYILKTIYSSFNEKFKSFTYDSMGTNNKFDWCQECGGGEVDLYNLMSWLFTDSASPECIVIYSDNLRCGIQFPIIYNGEFINLTSQFPKKWLFEDFEEELEHCKQAYIDKENEKKLYKENAKLARKLSSEEKKKIQESLKLKLTAEEYSVISFKK